MTESTKELAGSHHGSPDLFSSDITLLGAYRQWIETVWAARQDMKWLPGEIDCLKSRLFWRIRSGKSPLPSPPPTAYSCPWYEVIEEIRPHFLWEEVRFYEPRENQPETVAVIAQCQYVVIDRSDPKKTIVGFGPWRFRIWIGKGMNRVCMPDGKWKNSEVSGWLIERTPSEEYKTKVK